LPLLQRQPAVAPPTIAVDLANLCLDRGEPLPVPDPSRRDPDADVEEPLHLHPRASTAVELVPAGVVVP